MNDRRESLRRFTEALRRTGRGSRDAPPSTTLRATVDALAERASAASSREELQEAVTALQDLRGRVSAHDRTAPMLAFRTAQALLRLAEASGEVRHFQAAVAAAADAVEAVEAVEHLPPGHMNQAPFRVELSTALRMRGDRTGSVDDVDEAVEQARRASQRLPAGHPGRFAVLAAMGNALMSRYERQRDAHDLDGAVTAFREAVTLSSREPADAPASGATESATVPAPVATDRAAVLCGLGSVLHLRHRLTGSPADGDEALRCMTAALALVPRGPARALYNNNLTALLLARFESTGDRAELDRAVATAQESVDATTASDPALPGRLTVLSSALCIRAERFSDVEAVEDETRLIELARRAVELAPPGHPGLVAARTNWAHALSVRGQRTFSEADLHEAVDILRATVRSVPEGSPELTLPLANLGGILTARAEMTGSLSDLHEAVEAFRVCAALIPPSHDEHPMMLTLLGRALLMSASDVPGPSGRPLDAGGLRDLDEAVQVLRRALALTPPSHEQHTGRSAALSRALIQRHASRPVPDHAAHDLQGAGDDLQEAVEVCRTALRHAGPHRSDHIWACSELAMALLHTYRATRTPQVVTEALQYARQAVDALPIGSPSRANCLQTLGHILAESPDAARSDALAAFLEAYACEASPPADRIEAARAAARLAGPDDGELAGRLLTEAVERLAAAAPLWHAGSDRLKTLSRFAGLATEAAAHLLATSDPTVGGTPSPAAAIEALRLLETGREVLIRQALNLRTDLSALRQAHPRLAGELLGLHRRLVAPAGPSAEGQTAPPPPPSYDARPDIDRRRAASTRMESVLATVRSLPGFESFLRPPHRELLARAAESGPVVTLAAASDTGHALIATTEGVLHRRLPVLTVAAVTAQAARLHAAADVGHDRTLDPSARLEAQRRVSEILEWLWDAAVGPVLDTLGLLSSTSPEAGGHLWWAPGSLLGLLPLHAAGRRSGQHSHPEGGAAIDKVVSSYTPSIQALVAARDRPASRNPGRFLAVAMPYTAGAAPLPCAAEQTERLARLFDDATVLVTTSDAPRLPVPAVLTELAHSSVVHFACHAVSDPMNPWDSRLLLGDEPDSLTVRHLTDHHLPEAELAFLSACRTSHSSGLRIPDESVHLSGAMQHAGFRRVVATLWLVDDHHTSAVGEAFFAALRKTPHGLDTSLAPRALNHAVRQARSKYPTFPTLWAGYVHSGA
ncbi:CHAT domain-containing protein [Streptomyces sp. NPDC046925]|uniref:CHAT domain-containing tetratricopeptide repeat protein n=1 Tax=Streptomyces sp. NPDC046925 TaxID=3155375 RepID=UPI0033CCA929